MSTSSPFIAKPAAPSSPVGSIFPGDGWWPDIDIAEMRGAVRMGEMVPHERLIAALENAAITVGDDLTLWRADRERQGFTSLAEIEASKTVNGKTRLVTLYIGAVRYAAMGELMALSPDMSATNANETREDAKRETSCDFERLRLNNVRSILGVGRVAVELI